MDVEEILNKGKYLRDFKAWIYKRQIEAVKSRMKQQDAESTPVCVVPATDKSVLKE